MYFVFLKYISLIYQTETITIKTKQMTNLIQQSKQKSTNFFTIIDGIELPNYESIIVKKKVCEKQYYWHIQRALEGRFIKHYICCEVINNEVLKRKARLYENISDFEKAIKRIEKIIN